MTRHEKGRIVDQELQAESNLNHLQERTLHQASTIQISFYHKKGDVSYLYVDNSPKERAPYGDNSDTFKDPIVILGNNL